MKRKCVDILKALVRPQVKGLFDLCDSGRSKVCQDKTVAVALRDAFEYGKSVCSGGG